MDIDDYENLLNKAFDKIPENVKQSSRFQIPGVKLRYEGKNTYITNFVKILHTLNRTKKHFMGNFLKNAGTMGEIRGSQLFLKSRYKKDFLDKLIEEYADNYVFCDICGKPDTKMKKEGKKLFLKCTACGARKEIKE
ncbi:MAG: translation initiation factor IF-2 subunit beta [Candidatus Lokiarchaeota archaeon]